MYIGSEPVEADMFDKDGYGNIQVALLPHETLHIPFTFTTLVPYTQKNVGSQSRRKNKSSSHSSGSDRQRGDEKRNDGDSDGRLYGHNKQSEGWDLN
jgi:hypothetical protein